MTWKELDQQMFGSVSHEEARATIGKFCESLEAEVKALRSALYAMDTSIDAFEEYTKQANKLRDDREMIKQLRFSGV